MDLISLGYSKFR